MQTRHITHILFVSILIGLVVALAGCSGGGGNGGDPVARAGALLSAGCAIEEDEITGTVTADLGADDIFEIDGQPVQITADTVFEDGDAADLVVGQVVEAEGVLGADGVLVAVEVEIGDDGDDDDGDDAACEEDEIEGTITAGLGADDIFEIDGQPVQITADTVFEGGDAADLVVGQVVEAEGVLGPDGVLVAVEVEIGDTD